MTQRDAAPRSVSKTLQLPGSAQLKAWVTRHSDAGQIARLARRQRAIDDVKQRAIGCNQNDDVTEHESTGEGLVTQQIKIRVFYKRNMRSNRGKTAAATKSHWLNT